MSESTGTVAPAAAPPVAAPPTPASGGVDPGPPKAPASGQPALSVSEAGRLLSQQRRQQAAETRQSPAEPGRDAAEAPQRPADRAGPAEPAATPQQSRRQPGGLSAMERALGVPETGAAPGAGPSGESTPAAPSAPMGGYEIGGQRYSAEQLQQAISMAGDYTQKTQALAEARRQVESQQQALAQVLPYIQPELARLSQQVQGVAPPDPSLLDTDPQGYLRAFAQYQQAQAEQSRLGQLTVLQQQAQERAMAAQVEAANQELAREFSFWSDPAERSQAQQQIVEWALSPQGGFSKQELAGLTNARYLRTLMKAMAFDKWVTGAKTAAPVASVRAPVRGSPPPPAPSERITQADQRFSEVPNVRNAAALLSARRAAAR